MTNHLTTEERRAKAGGRREAKKEEDGGRRKEAQGAAAVLPEGVLDQIGRTARGSCNRTLLRRVLRRFSNGKCFLEGFLEGACTVDTEIKVK